MIAQNLDFKFAQHFVPTGLGDKWWFQGEALLYVQEADEDFECEKQGKRWMNNDVSWNIL